MLTINQELSFEICVLGITQLFFISKVHLPPPRTPLHSPALAKALYKPLCLVLCVFSKDATNVFVPSELCVANYKLITNTEGPSVHYTLAVLIL